jgi:hypothetical protein
MAAGYGLNWLLGTAAMPHSRIQFDIGKPEFGFVGMQESRRADCGCVKWFAHSDQGERSVTMPAHFPKFIRIQ